MYNEPQYICIYTYLVYYVCHMCYSWYIPHFKLSQYEVRTESNWVTKYPTLIRLSRLKFPKIPAKFSSSRSAAIVGVCKRRQAIAAIIVIPATSQSHISNYHTPIYYTQSSTDQFLLHLRTLSIGGVLTLQSPHTYTRTHKPFTTQYRYTGI